MVKWTERDRNWTNVWIKIWRIRINGPQLNGLCSNTPKSSHTVLIMPQGSGTFLPKEQVAAGLLLLSRLLTPFPAPYSCRLFTPFPASYSFPGFLLLSRLLTPFQKYRLFSKAPALFKSPGSFPAPYSFPRVLGSWLPWLQRLQNPGEVPLLPRRSDSLLFGSTATLVKE